MLHVPCHKILLPEKPFWNRRCYLIHAVCPVLLQCTVFLQTLWVLTDHLPVRKADWKIGGLIVCSPHSAVSSFISIFPSRKALDAELWSLRLYRPHPQTELSGGLSGAKAAVQKLEKIDNWRQDMYVVTLCVCIMQTVLYVLVWEPLLNVSSCYCSHRVKGILDHFSSLSV